MVDEQQPVLVIGATGQQGRAVTHALLERGRAVHALVRDPGSPAAKILHEAGAKLVTGDLDDASSIRAAMTPAQGVFLMLTMMTGAKVTAEGVAAEERRGKAVAEIAAETGIGHLVYSSLRGAGAGTGIPYYESKERIQEHIHSLDLPATVLYPVSFMDNYATYNRPAEEDGELVFRLAVHPEIRLPQIAVRDIGAFAAIAFQRPDEFIGRNLEIAGDELTGPEIAETFARVTGRPARFQELPIEHLRAFDEQVARMFEWFNENHPGPDLDVLRAIHPDLMALETWLRTTSWK